VFGEEYLRAGVYLLNLLSVGSTPSQVRTNRHKLNHGSGLPMLAFIKVRYIEPRKSEEMIIVIELRPCCDNPMLLTV
jgi:hypothetical protein